jgi:hypothetical protein
MRSSRRSRRGCRVANTGSSGLKNATKAQNMWRIENILKAERCEAIVENDSQRDSMVFFGRGVKGDVVRIVTRLDERGNVYADLAEVTMLNGGRMKKLPPRKPLAEIVETVVNRRQRGWSTHRCRRKYATIRQRRQQRPDALAT